MTLPIRSVRMTLLIRSVQIMLLICSVRLVLLATLPRRVRQIGPRGDQEGPDESVRVMGVPHIHDDGGVGGAHDDSLCPPIHPRKHLRDIRPVIRYMGDAGCDHRRAIPDDHRTAEGGHGPRIVLHREGDGMVPGDRVGSGHQRPVGTRTIPEVPAVAHDGGIVVIRGPAVEKDLLECQ